MADEGKAAATVAVMGVVYWIAYAAAVAVVFSIVATVIAAVIGVVALLAALYKITELDAKEAVGFVAVAMTAIPLPFFVMYFWVMEGQASTSSSEQSGGQELLSLFCFFWLVGTLVALGSWLSNK